MSRSAEGFPTGAPLGTTGDGMDIGGRRGPLYWTAAAAVIGALLAGTGCRQMPTHAEREPVGPAREEITGMAGAARGGGGRGGACVLVKPDGAQRCGQVGWGPRVTGTDRWVYGAVENPSGRLYTLPIGDIGDIGAWHAQGTYARMLSEMSRDTNQPGRSEHPYSRHPHSRHRCTSSMTADVPAARSMVPVVAERGFLMGKKPTPR